jgi:hypothetical protein
MTTTNVPPVATAKAIEPDVPPVIVDLGKQSRKRIRNLREGRGKLMRDISEVVAVLKAEGSVEKSAQVVVVVVTRRAKPRITDLLGGL